MVRISDLSLRRRLSKEQKNRGQPLNDVNVKHAVRRRSAEAEL